jgi:hypothetical protein
MERSNVTYAQVTTNTITTESGLPPQSARRLDTGQWVLGLRDAPVSLQQACGWFAVTENVRPADTPTTTYDRSLTLVANVPTVTWTARPKTADEIKADTVAVNDPVIRTKVRAAIDGNVTALGQLDTAVTNVNAVIAATPTNVAQCNTQIDNLANVVKNLALESGRMMRQITAMERLLIGSDLLESDAGT